MGDRSHGLGRYRRCLTIDDEYQISLHLKDISEAKKYDGKWVLITNDVTITIEDAAAGYKGLLIIERCFKTLKRTRIKMEPMYHWLPRRIEAHVKLCVFALLIERAAEFKCKEPWSRIGRVLETLQASEFESPNHQFFQRNEAGLELGPILKSLDIPMPKVVLNVSSARGNTQAHDDFRSPW